MLFIPEPRICIFGSSRRGNKLSLGDHGLQLVDNLPIAYGSTGYIIPP